MDAGAGKSFEDFALVSGRFHERARKQPSRFAALYCLTSAKRKSSDLESKSLREGVKR